MCGACCDHSCRIARSSPSIARWMSPWSGGISLYGRLVTGGGWLVYEWVARWKGGEGGEAGEAGEVGRTAPFGNDHSASVFICADPAARPPSPASPASPPRHLATPPPRHLTTPPPQSLS